MIHIPALPPAAQIFLSILSLLFGFGASLSYIISVVKKEVSPRPLTWLGWVILMGVSLLSQIIAKGWQWNQTGLALSTLMCSIITAFALRHGKILHYDWICLVLGLACLIVYVSTLDPFWTTIVGIAGDLTISVPLLHGAYANQSENSKAWIFSALAWFTTILNCTGYGIVYYLFPVYLFTFALVMIWFGKRKSGSISQAPA